MAMKNQKPRDLYYMLEMNIEKLEKAAKGHGKHKQAAKERLAFLRRQAKKTPEKELKALARKANNRLRRIESAGLVSATPAYSGIVYTKLNSKNRDIVFTKSDFPEFRTDVENMTAEQKKTLQEFLDKFLKIKTSTITGIKKRIDKKANDLGIPKEYRKAVEFYQYWEVIYTELLRLGYISQEAEYGTDELLQYFSDTSDIDKVPAWVSLSMQNFSEGSHPAIESLMKLWDSLVNPPDAWEDDDTDDGWDVL